MPVAIPGSLAASLAIQACMVGAIAEIYGHDSKAPPRCYRSSAPEKVWHRRNTDLFFLPKGLKIAPRKREVCQRSRKRSLTGKARGVLSLPAALGLRRVMIAGNFDIDEA